MNAYQFDIAGIRTVVLAEDDEAVLEKCFGHMDKARQIQNTVEGEGKLLAEGTIIRLSDDGVVSKVEVYTNEVKFVPPEGRSQ